MKIAVEADAVLRDIEALAEKNFLPIIGPIKGEFLIDTIKRFHVKKVLEVGTLIGYSAILIAKNLARDGEVISIEMNRNAANRAAENIRRAGLDDKIRVYVGNALEVIPGIDEKFDMIFLDATKNEYLAYLRLFEDRLNKGGVVFADNAKRFAHEMRDYLDYVRTSGRYESKYIDVGFDGVEISVKLF